MNDKLRDTETEHLEKTGGAVQTNHLARGQPSPESANPWLELLLSAKGVEGGTLDDGTTERRMGAATATMTVAHPSQHMGSPGETGHHLHARFTSEMPFGTGVATNSRSRESAMSSSISIDATDCRFTVRHVEPFSEMPEFETNTFTTGVANLGTSEWMA